MADALLAVVFLVGLAALVYGAWLIYEPAGWLTAGLALVATVVLFQRGRDTLDLSRRRT